MKYLLGQSAVSQDFCIMQTYYTKHLNISYRVTILDNLAAHTSFQFFPSPICFEVLGRIPKAIRAFAL